MWGHPYEQRESVTPRMLARSSTTRRGQELDHSFRGLTLKMFVEQTFHNPKLVKIIDAFNVW